MVSRVVIVSAVYPYPVDSGKRVVLSGLAEYWTDRLGPANVHYVVVGRPAVSPPGPAGLEVHVVARPGPVEQVANLVWRTVLRRRSSMQESFLRGRAVRRTLASLLADIDADLEIYDTVRMSQYADQMPAGRRRVVYLDDLFSRRYREMVAAMRRDPGARFDALGEFASTVPGPLRVLLRIPLLQRAVLSAEAWLIARREDETARRFPVSLLINSLEAEMLAARSGSSGVAVLPPRVVEPSSRERAYDGRPEFVFLGLLSLPHNAHAIKLFLRQQMPRVIALLPEVRLRIVGRAADDELRALAAPFGANVSVEGFVEDLDDLLSTSAAMLCPLTFGTGVKLKVIQALARGLPVLSTPVGVEGAAAGREHGCVVVSDLDRFPELMREVTDEEVNAGLSAAARRHYEDAFSPSAVKVAYDAVFEVPRGDA